MAASARLSARRRLWPPRQIGLQMEGPRASIFLRENQLNPGNLRVAAAIDPGVQAVKQLHSQSTPRIPNSGLFSSKP